MKHPEKKQTEAYRSRSRSEALFDFLQLPEDVMEDALQIHMSGDRKLIISNHRKLLVYLENQICLCGKKQRVTVCGRNLCIPSYSEEALYISGRIQSISLESLYE